MSTRPNNEISLGLEVLRLVARGLAGAEIARALHIDPETVRGRLFKLYRRIGARNAAHAVAIAGVERLLSAEDLRAAVADRRVGWKQEEEA